MICLTKKWPRPSMRRQIPWSKRPVLTKKWLRPSVRRQIPWSTRPVLTRTWLRPSMRRQITVPVHEIPFDEHKSSFEQDHRQIDQGISKYVSTQSWSKRCVLTRVPCLKPNWPGNCEIHEHKILVNLVLSRGPWSKRTVLTRILCSCISKFPGRFGGGFAQNATPQGISKPDQT